MSFEKGTRSGICYISNRYSQANNKYFKTYNPKQESKPIIYLDGNNSYGYAMFKCFPTSRFIRIDPKKFDFNKYTGNSSKGCAVEVDLDVV